MLPSDGHRSQHSGNPSARKQRTQLRVGYTGFLKQRKEGALLLYTSHWTPKSMPAASEKPVVFHLISRQRLLTFGNGSVAVSVAPSFPFVLTC